LAEELQVHRAAAVGTAIIGDINVHSKRWLKYSTGESPEGALLQDICLSAGLKQIVTEPTREGILLDLVMTDIPGTEATVGGKVQDHQFVLTKFNFAVPESKSLEREVWNYGKADWTRSRERFAEHDREVLRRGTPSEAAKELTETILDYARECIGKRAMKEVRSTHPWMTEKVIEAKEKLREAEGTDKEKEESERCSEVLLEARTSYIKKTKEELET